MPESRRRIRSRWTASLAVLTLASLVGCGAKPVEPIKPEELAGAVDPKLSKEQQARQRAIRDVLVTLQQGMPADKIPRLVPGIRFNETDQQFLDGSSRLVRWGFGGPPTGDEVPVVLTFTKGDGSRELQKVERVYLAKGSSGRFTVSRK